MKRLSIPARTIPWAILALALVVRLLTAWPLQQPGYTDAYYYSVGAQQLHHGQGLDEPFVWNYLDPPPSVPHPGYDYWLPLPALLGWLGMMVFGDSFRAMQMPFILLSALLPLVSYAVAWDMSGRRDHAVLAACMTIFPGFYTLVFTIPETFAPFALAGGVCLWAAGRGLRGQGPLWFGLAGVAAGFAHLTRADGLLLLGIALLSALIPGSTPISHSEKLRCMLLSLAAAGAGYSLVMGPWFFRNWLTFGTPFPGGGIQTMFLTVYDDIFSFAPSLTPETYLAWGWDQILKSKADALLQNLLRLWAEIMFILLPPFMAVGVWHQRKDRLLWPFFLYLPGLFLAMTFAFTLPGVRGALYHSGGALLPCVFACALLGLDIVLRWAARRLRGWSFKKAWPLFASGLLAIAVLISIFGMWRSGAFGEKWNSQDLEYVQVSQWLKEQGAQDDVIMVTNPPSFAWHTGHLSVMTPNDPLDTLLAVADRYGARYLVLDSGRPRTTDALYAGETAHPRLVLRHTLDRGEEVWQIYEITAHGSGQSDKKLAASTRRTERP